MTQRYLEAEKVTLPARAPLFVEPGHCQWCNKELTGRAKFYCRPTPESLYSNMSDCAASFLIWWCSRPAYVRATFLRDNFTCKICGFHRMREKQPWLPDISNLECDHIIPLARGGTTTMANLQTLCRRCNRAKGTLIIGEKKENYPRVVPSRDNGRCPECRQKGYDILPWEPPPYYDPLMIKVQCTKCGAESYIPPMPTLRKVAKVRLIL